jgi:hypothetical protein
MASALEQAENSSKLGAGTANSTTSIPPNAPSVSAGSFNRVQAQGSPYRSGRSPDWLKMKNPEAPAVKREAEEDWGKDR